MIELHCKCCDIKFNVKPSHVNRRSFCSRKCYAVDKMKNTPVHLSICSVCGSSFIVRSNNKRIKLVCSIKCRHELSSILTKKKGTSPWDFLNKDNWLKSAKSAEKSKKLSIALLGSIKETEKTRKFSPLHSKALHGYISSPDNYYYKIDNVTKFVKENENLFPHHSIKWGKVSIANSAISCLAVNGLCQVLRGHRGSWHGWRFVTKSEFNSIKNYEN